jgi:hypothetical protein
MHNGMQSPKTDLQWLLSLQVNISNTWFLPQEGFPVFYRYFRDRITWFEADAVCQFHHGNLVTGEFLCLFNDALSIVYVKYEYG